VAGAHRLLRFFITADSVYPQVNRATAQSAQETALDEGLAPLAGWVKRLVDSVIQDRMGHGDLEFIWSDVRSVDPKDQASIIDIYVKDGVYTLNEARNILGFAPFEGGDQPMFQIAPAPVVRPTVLEPRPPNRK